MLDVLEENKDKGDYLEWKTRISFWSHNNREQLRQLCIWCINSTKWEIMWEFSRSSSHSEQENKV